MEQKESYSKEFTLKTKDEEKIHYCDILQKKRHSLDCGRVTNNEMEIVRK